MAQPAIVEQLNAAVAGRPPIFLNIKSKNRRKLFNRQREIPSHPLQASHKNARPFGYTQARHAGNHRCGSTDDLRVDGAIGSDNDLAQRFGFAITEKVTPVPLHLFDHFVLDRFIGDDRLFRRTQRSVVETLPRENVAHGFLDIGRRFNVGGYVARANAVGRLSSTIGGAYQTVPSSRQDQRRLAVLHQFLGRLPAWAWSCIG